MREAATLKVKDLDSMRTQDRRELADWLMRQAGEVVIKDKLDSNYTARYYTDEKKR